jgi:hypothetical protein
MTTTLKIFPPVPETEWLPGAPAHITVEVVITDRRTYSRCRCAACGRRGLNTTAQDSGGRYRIVGRCGRCGAVEVF